MDEEGEEEKETVSFRTVHSLCDGHTNTTVR